MCARKNHTAQTHTQRRHGAHRCVKDGTKCVFIAFAHISYMYFHDMYIIYVYMSRRDSDLRYHYLLPAKQLAPRQIPARDHTRLPEKKRTKFKNEQESVKIVLKHKIETHNTCTSTTLLSVAVEFFCLPSEKKKEKKITKTK